MKFYYDESVFIDCFIYRKMKQPIAVFNGADKFLLSRYNLPIREKCQETLIALNPVNPCADLNMFSLSKKYSFNNFVYRHSVVHVVRQTSETDIFKAITFEDPAYDIIYDVNNELTSMEMAIMVKFYSLQCAAYKETDPSDSNNLVKITATLYHTIAKWFYDDDRNWFRFDNQSAIMRNAIGHNLKNGQLINAPLLQLTRYDHEV